MPGASSVGLLSDPSCPPAEAEENGANITAREARQEGTPCRLVDLPRPCSRARNEVESAIGTDHWQGRGKGTYEA